MKKIIFSFLLLLCTYCRANQNSSCGPSFSLDEKKRLSSYLKKDGSMLFYTYDHLNRLHWINSSDSLTEYEFFYDGENLEPELIYNHGQALNWSRPFPENLLFAEEVPLNVYLQIKLGKIVLMGAGQLAKVGIFLARLGQCLPAPFNRLFNLSSLLLKLSYNPIQETPYVYLLKTLGKNEEPIRLGYLNGMMNIGPEESLYSGELILSHTDEDPKLDLFYMPSHGYVLDLLECVILKAGLETPNTVRFREEFRRILAALPKNTKYILLLHSKASLVAETALSQLTEEEIQKMEIYSFAPVSLLGDKYASKVHNISSKFDVIFLQNPVGLVKYLFSREFKNSCFEWLPPLEWLPFLDHRFASETYQHRIKVIIAEILESYRLAN
ncbi:MAG: hypothetical protein WC371_01610 [Parachlamydiales bacterium]|jgi:hypothetical protein